VLTVRGLRKLYPSAKRHARPTVALAGVDLHVPAGGFVGVLGPSGSGKTTLLRCIAGFETPDAGRITLGTRTLVSPERSLRPFERGVGVVPQEGALFPHLSVAQNIGFGLTGSTRQRRRERVAELLELVGMAGLGDRRPDQLSGGQQQRVALARALAPEPELILLDEPFSALDAQLRAGVRREVRELLRGLGSTVLLVTHDQAEALSMSDHLIVMREGRVTALFERSEATQEKIMLAATQTVEPVTLLE
jgi:iron(III) transport system ATP-binding protein